MKGRLLEAVRDFAEEVHARVLCLSCALDIHLPDAADLIASVRQARPGILVLAGGAAFAGNARQARTIGADHYATDVREVRRLLPTLLGELAR